MQDHFEMPTAKRQKISGGGRARRSSQAQMAMKPSPTRPQVVAESSPSLLKGNSTSQGKHSLENRQPNESLEPGTSAASLVMSKPRRVRTGCLTCRNRHLKCDEAMPICLNCQKSNRKCERGVRLNFIDLKVEQPPYLLPPVDWNVQFQDESRQIASEYVGGLARYAKLGQQVVTPIWAAAVDVEPGARRAIDPSLVGHRQYVENPRMGHSQPILGLYDPGNLSRPLHEPAYSAYNDQMGQIFSRKSNPYLVIGSGPTPTSSKSGGGGRTAFGMGTIHDLYSVGEETAQPVLGYRTSGVFSVASPFGPQGMAVSSSGSYRQATGSGAPDPHDGLMTPQSDKNGERDFLSSPEEVQYMQVFIEEVAVWMDSLDNQKHFGRVIPYLALKSPMLLNAFLACGVKHLTLVDRGSYKDDKALYYYDTATTQLLRSLQNPERNTAECATTAVVLNVYEIMSEKPAARMNHIAGARALIRECKWDATSTGIGAACFWLNVGMEVLSCLAFNWATAWDPDLWGVDPDELMQMAPDSPGSERTTPITQDGGRVLFPTTDDFPSAMSRAGGVGDEGIWVHRILYITAKVANFRANIPQFQEPNPHEEQVRQQSRFAEWQRLKIWCDTWNANCPRSMRPYGYLFGSSTKSGFPNVWLIKRSAIVGRLFYHTVMCLLAQANPLKASHHDDDDTRPLQLHHAHQVCGIVAHTKDHGVASVAVRSLAIAGSVLHEPREQREVLEILTRIYHHTGWNLNRIHQELKRAWGWEPPEPAPSSGPGSTAGLHHPTPHQPLPTPAVQGGSNGTAAVISQLFGPRSSDGGQQQQQQQHPDSQQRHSSSFHPAPHHGGPLAPIHPPTMTATALANEARCANFSSALPPPHPQQSQPQPQHCACGSAAAVAAGHNSAASASSGHTSPAGTTATQAHTPASVSSAANNAPTPPGRPMVNPLLAQADFTQPNHPYREWYKPPERTATGGGGGGAGGSRGGAFKAGGLWPH